MIEQLKLTQQIKLAEAIAKQYHKGQKYGSKDYFEYHIKGVVAKVEDSFRTASKNEEIFEHFYKLRCTIVAYLHDVIEDSDLTLDNLRAYGFDEEIVIAVAYLTKTEDTIIDEYLEAVRENSIALRVKKGDMSFNMENCIKEGNYKRFSKYAEQMKVLLS